MIIQQEVQLYGNIQLKMLLQVYTYQALTLMIMINLVLTRWDLHLFINAFKTSKTIMILLLLSILAAHLQLKSIMKIYANQPYTIMVESCTRMSAKACFLILLLSIATICWPTNPILFPMQLVIPKYKEKKVVT